MLRALNTTNLASSREAREKAARKKTPSPHLHKLRVTKARPDEDNAVVKVCQALGNRGLGESQGHGEGRCQGGLSSDRTPPCPLSPARGEGCSHRGQNSSPFQTPAPAEKCSAISDVCDSPFSTSLQPENPTICLEVPIPKGHFNPNHFSLLKTVRNL